MLRYFRATKAMIVQHNEQNGETTAASIPQIKMTMTLFFFSENRTRVLSFLVEASSPVW